MFNNTNQLNDNRSSFSSQYAARGLSITGWAVTFYVLDSHLYWLTFAHLSARPFSSANNRRNHEYCWIQITCAQPIICRCVICFVHTFVQPGYDFSEGFNRISPKVCYVFCSFFLVQPSDYCYGTHHKQGRSQEMVKGGGPLPPPPWLRPWPQAFCIVLCLLRHSYLTSTAISRICVVSYFSHVQLMLSL
jgi:hypothetical protein